MEINAGMPSSDTAKGFEFPKEYYGEDSLIKGFVICRGKKDFSVGKGIKAINLPSAVWP